MDFENDGNFEAMKIKLNYASKSENEFSHRAKKVFLQSSQRNFFGFLPATVTKRSCQTKISVISEIQFSINFDEISISLFKFLMCFFFLFKIY